MGPDFRNTLQGKNQCDKYIPKATECNSHILWWFPVEMQVWQLLGDLRHSIPFCLWRGWHNIASIKPPLMRNCPVKSWQVPQRTLETSKMRAYVSKDQKSTVTKSHDIKNIRLHEHAASVTKNQITSKWLYLYSLHNHWLNYIYIK